MTTSAPTSPAPAPRSVDGARDLAGLLRTEPFRIFFPLALVIGVAGISHWLLLSTGAIGSYYGFFHAVTQMQAFLLAFAAGFLLTAIPKRTQSAPASPIEIGALAVLLPAISILTFLELTVSGQLAYFLTLALLTQFAVRRFLSRSSGRRPPASFVLVPLGFAAGFSGSILHSIALHADVSSATRGLGRALVFQGLFLCLTLGIGAFFLPLALRGEAAADLDKASRKSILGYLLGGLVMLGGLALEEAGFYRIGPLIRGVAAVAILIGSGAYRLPAQPGANRFLVWTSAWAVPLGMLGIAAMPEHRLAALHISFIGGFGLLAFAVAAHVTLGHGGFYEKQRGWPIAVIGYGVLFGLAVVARALATTTSIYYLNWVGVAAALWLAGALVWGAFLLPKLWRKSNPPPPPPQLINPSSLRRGP